MKILAIDTANLPLSVAVTDDDTLLATTTINCQKNHAKSLLPTIQATLKQANTDKSELDRIAVSIGPGSYTGLRIGVAVAKMLAYALDIDLVTYSSLEVLVAPLKIVTDKVLVPLFDARRDNVFAAAWNSDGTTLKEVLPAGHYAFNQLLEKATATDKSVLLIGSDASHFEAHIKNISNVKIANAAFAYPQAFIGALIAVNKQPVAVASLTPEYLRLTQAEAQWLEKHNQEETGNYVEKYEMEKD